MRGCRLGGPCTDPGTVGIEIQGTSSERFGRSWMLGRLYRPMRRNWSPATRYWRGCHDVEHAPPVRDGPGMGVYRGGYDRLCFPLHRDPREECRSEEHTSELQS